MNILVQVIGTIVGLVIMGFLLWQMIGKRVFRIGSAVAKKFQNTEQQKRSESLLDDELSKYE